MEAEDQDRKPRVLPLDVSEQFQPAPTGEIQVQHDRVKRPGPELVESLRRVARFGADATPRDRGLIRLERAPNTSRDAVVAALTAAGLEGFGNGQPSLLYRCLP